jgi:hypothetical protein
MPGGVKPGFSCPATVPAAIATFIKQAGHKPRGASAANGAWQFSQSFCVSIFSYPLLKESAAPVTNYF